MTHPVPRWGEWSGGVGTSIYSCGCSISHGMGGGSFVLSAKLCSIHAYEAGRRGLAVATLEDVANAIRILGNEKNTNE